MGALSSSNASKAENQVNSTNSRCL